MDDFNEIQRPQQEYCKRIAAKYVYQHDKNLPIKERLVKCQKVLEALIWYSLGSYFKHSKNQLRELSYLPALHTTSGQIACQVNRHRKTIVNHRHILQDAGLIHQPRLDATGIWLYIHPQLLVEKPMECQKERWAQLTQKPYQPLFFDLTVQTEGRLHASKSNNTNSGVEIGKTPISTESGLETLETASNENKKPFARNGEEERAQKKNEQSPSPQPVKARNRFAHHGGGPAQDLIDQEKLLQYIETFWCLAKRTLYPGVNFTAHTEQEAKSTIWKNVYYAGQTSWNTAQWDAQHKMNLGRLQLAHRWLLRPHPEGKEKYIPTPHVYFNAEKKFGFEGTKEWYLREQTVRNQVIKQRNYEKYLATLFDGDTTKRKPMSGYELWQICKSRVAKLQDRFLMNAFLASTQNLKFTRKP